MTTATPVQLHRGSATDDVTADDASEMLDELLAGSGPLGRVLLLPPDQTRSDSWAGPLTCMLHAKLLADFGSEVTVLPTIGTHKPMRDDQLAAMYPGIPREAFAVHDWRGGVVGLGEVPAEFVREATGGLVDFAVPVQVARTVAEGGWDRMFSVGQLVPHEVIGIANGNKNLFVGAGGKAIIDRTHYIGAAFGMERVMGRTDTPVRRVLNYAEDHLAGHLPVTYVLTVRQKDESGTLRTRGLYLGEGRDGFAAGAELARQVNVYPMPDRPERVVVHLDPKKYDSTWLGNKAIYRTRMAIADGGTLEVIAPGVHSFGEDEGIDALIRKYGYRGTRHTIDLVAANADLRENLSAAAHLMHGSADGRFAVRYAAAGLSDEEVRGVGFEPADCAALTAHYRPATRSTGWHTDDRGRYFFIADPGLGLWADPASLR